MRKAQVRVWRTQLKAPAPWRISIEKNGTTVGILDASSYAEAMFLAQLLADPHEYIRAAQERAWHGGKSVGRLQEYFVIPSPTSPYRKEDQ